jgi:hypothetical protein
MINVLISVLVELMPAVIPVKNAINSALYVLQLKHVKYVNMDIYYTMVFAILIVVLEQLKLTENVYLVELDVKLVINSILKNAQNVNLQTFY